jgi:hypothetical protein
MEHIRTFPRMFSLVMFLGIASLALPLTAHAGGLHVSVVLGLPVPVVVAPAPVVVRRPPVIVGAPCGESTRPYYGGYHRHWRHWKHHHHERD